MHPGAIYGKERLGQECCQETVSQSDGLDGVASSDDGIRGFKRIYGDEVYLMLAGGYLMMAGLDTNTHLGQLGDYLPAHIRRQIGGEIEVAAAVMRQRPTRYA